MSYTLSILSTETVKLNVSHTSANNSIASATTIAAGVGKRPGEDNCIAAKSSEHWVKVLDVCLCFLSFHTSFALSNALNRHFLVFKQVHWCLVSTLSCWKARPHGHRCSSEEVDAMNCWRCWFSITFGSCKHSELGLRWECCDLQPMITANWVLLSFIIQAEIWDSGT